MGRIADFGRISAPLPKELADSELIRALEENWFIGGARDLLDVPKGGLYRKGVRSYYRLR